MSSISWDEHQMVALLAWLESNLTLIHGEVRVESADIPPEAFSGEVDLDKRQFCVYANPENPMLDTTLNIFLAYILALAYDRDAWINPIPTEEAVIDCHRLVCEAMLDFHEDFSADLEEHLQVLEVWLKAYGEDPNSSTESSTDSSTDSLVTNLGNQMFSRTTKNDKWNIN